MMPDFIVQYYLIILITVVFILFAIIGYLAENVKKKEAEAKAPPKEAKPEKQEEPVVTEAPKEVVNVPEIPEAEAIVETLEDNK